MKIESFWQSIVILSMVIMVILVSFVFAVTITNLDYPQDTSFINMVPVDFNFTAEDDINVTNCTLWANFSGTWQANETMYPTTNDSTTWNVTISPEDGFYEWNVLCFDNETIPNEDWYTNNYTVTIDTTPPAWSNNQANASDSTKTNWDVYFNLTWNDINPEYSILSIDETGNFVNQSPAAYTSGIALYSIYTINALRGTLVKWKFHANDSAGNWNVTGTWQFTVNNTQPTHSIPILNATDNPNNYTSANLTCYNQTTADADSDSVTNIYKWYRNDVMQSSFENSTYINSTDTTKNDAWLCEITPFDSYDYGIPLNSTSFTIKNSPPKINLNASAPSSIIENIDVYIYANVTDDDSDNIVWVNFTITAPNGTIIINNQNASSNAGDIWNSSTFTASAVGTWTWSITASDGLLTDTTTGSFTLATGYVIFGNVSGKLALQDSSTRTLIDWTVTNTSGSNIYVADSDSTINFNSLTAISRTISGSPVSNDFEEIDTAINTTNLTDSLNTTFTTNGNPKNTNTFTIFDVSVNNVPIINSTNSSNFITGILWDSSDDQGNSQYDSTDKEDLIFITKVDTTLQGKYGFYDYEIWIPANLKKYITADVQSVSIYAEIR